MQIRVSGYKYEEKSMDSTGAIECCGAPVEKKILDFGDWLQASWHCPKCGELYLKDVYLDEGVFTR
jgi:hypothetical protein